MRQMVQEQESIQQQLPTAVKTVVAPVQHIEKRPVYDFLKRAFDIFAAVLGLIVGFPFLLIIALVIYIDDPGNPFFVQTRIGKDGQPFRMIKFRTMYKDAEERKEQLMAQNEYDGVHYKCVKDVRILKSGYFLRRYSLDELPQIINVLLNQMSLIGPRPFVPSEQEQLPLDRLSVKPGLSCYWQLADKRELSDAEQLELDYRYIRERSIKTDFKIIFMTVRMVLGGKNC